VSTARHHKQVFRPADALEAGPDMVGVDDLVLLATGEKDGLGIGRGRLTRLVVEDGVVALKAVGPDVERVSQLLRQ
jgi:hypothetical protein